MGYNEHVRSRKTYRKGTKMGNFQYEWWTVEIGYEEMNPIVVEIKGKSRQHVINQINKMVEYSRSEKNAKTDMWHRQPVVREVFWNTLALDRKGYQRLY